jgi:drug/metabolite transporter (DMT)-like permease
MVTSLVAGVVAALLYGIASIMQAIAVREASNREASEVAGPGAGVDPGLLVRMLSQWRFVASICLDTLGFIAQLVALQRLPLFAVQAMVAANLAVIAVLSSFVIRVALSWREWLAVGGVVIGVGLLGSSAGAEGATQAGAVFKLALIVAVGGLGLVGIVAARLRNPARTFVLGTVAGLGYGVLGIAARVLNGFAPLTLIKDPASYAVIAAGIVSFAFYASALEGGSVTVATAAVVLAETLPPAVIGVIFLGDTTRPGLEPAAAVGFLVAVASAVMLARFGEAERAAQAEASAAHQQSAASQPPEETGGAAAGPQESAPPDMPTQRSAFDDPTALHAGELTPALPTTPGPSREANRRVLSWWPVDMRSSAASSPTTGAVSWQ